jgi:hypothetical protein
VPPPGHDVDLRPRGLSELGPVAVAVDLELLDGLHRGVDQDRAVRADVVVVDAVDRPHVGVGRVAAHREVRPAEQPLVPDVQVIGGHNTRLEQGELQEVAAVEGELAGLLSRDQTGDVPAHRLHRDRRDLHRDRFGDLAGLEPHVDGAHVGHVQVDSRHRRPLEPGVLDAHAVTAHGKLGEHVVSRRVRRHRSGEAGFLSGQGDRRPRDNRPGRVSHRAADRRGGPLARCRRREEEETRQEDEALAHGHALLPVGPCLPLSPLLVVLFGTQ